MKHMIKWIVWLHREQKYNNKKIKHNKSARIYYESYSKYLLSKVVRGNYIMLL